jgi:hypothetical protein
LAGVGAQVNDHDAAGSGFTQSQCDLLYGGTGKNQ